MPDLANGPMGEAPRGLGILGITELPDSPLTIASCCATTIARTVRTVRPTADSMRRT
jgi:hypothetical protein